MNDAQRYRSTRATVPQDYSYEDAVMLGLAKDGGLLLPSSIPKVSSDTLDTWKTLSFQELAFEIMRLYVSSTDIPDDDLKELIKRSYGSFRSEKVTPVKPLDVENGLYLLELFHGPTYAFKDVALQFLGNLFEYFLQRRNKNAKTQEERDRITVVGATSGDTGSAAIHGLNGKKDISVFILYPNGRISPIQEQQMVTVEDPNVHALSVEGTFDDCQDYVKQIFADEEFNKHYHVGAVNSINWARILSQMTYYFYSYFETCKLLEKKEAGSFRFVVPSGNFGDMLAGYYAKEMGLPVEKLVIATNENDILDRFMKSGCYSKSAEGKKAEVKASYSPAMDILISSNFERVLWYLIRDTIANKNNEKAGEILSGYMLQLKANGLFSVPDVILNAAREIFDSERVSDEATAETIKQTYQRTSEKYVLDPHSAVGVTTAYRKMQNDENSGIRDVKYISLATAHPAKFAEVVNHSLKSFETYNFERDVLPENLKELGNKKKRLTLIEKPTIEKIKEAIIERVDGKKISEIFPNRELA